MTLRLMEMKPSHKILIDMEGKKFNLTPYYQVPVLPTRGIGYPEGAKVFYRLYTMREAMEVSSMTKLYDTIRFTLEGIKTEGMPKEDLFVPDFLFVSLLRAGSSGTVTHLKVSTTCQNCGESFEDEVPIESVYVEDLEHVRKYVPIEGTDYKVILEVPRVGRLLEALEFGEKNPGLAEMANGAVPIVGIAEGEKETFLSVREVVDMMDELPQHVVLENQEYFSEGMTSAIVEVECPHCEYQNKVRVGSEDSLSLVKPFRKS